MAGLLAADGGEVEPFALAATDLSPERFEELGRWLGSRSANEPTVVIYIDEIDAWGRDRLDMRHSDKTRGTLLGALAAIDGLDGSSQNRVLWLPSSNASPRQLDRALVCAGRYGFSIRIDMPTLVERAEILTFYASKRRVAADIDWTRVAALAVWSSPADLRQALDDALADGGPRCGCPVAPRPRGGLAPPPDRGADRVD